MTTTGATTGDRPIDVPPSPPDAGDAALAARALELAGLVIEPGTRTPADRALGRTLLAEAFVAAARAVTRDPSLRTLEAARAALEATGELGRAAGGDAPARTVVQALTSDGDGDARNVAGLRLAEVTVGQLLRTARGKPRRALTPRRRAIYYAGAFALVVAAVVVPRFGPRPRWESYRWKVSSVEPSYKVTGTLGEHGFYDLIFHTQNQSNPWVVIDMLAPRSVDHVVIRNRQDCCIDRGLPMVVELGMDGESFTPVARRTEPFDTWTVDFAPREARYMRIRAEATTVLHLVEIQIS